MIAGWLGSADIETYRFTKQQLQEFLHHVSDERDINHVNSMIRGCEYVIEWLETGRRPGNKRGVERLAAYQREIPLELMDRYARPPEPVRFESEIDWVRMEYILSMLTDRERECYEMHIGGLYSMREVGRMLGISMQAVCDNIKRAENKIKRYKSKPMPILLEMIV